MSRRSDVGIGLVAGALVLAGYVLIIGAALQMFGAADNGDTPHTIAWAAVLLMFTYLYGSRSDR